MNETMGSIIARLRKEKGMTQEQLANELGISYQAVSKWENELSSPDISALPLLAELFDVSIDELFGREQKTSETAAAAESPAAGEPCDPPLYRELPWPDDDTLHVVLFAGHRLVGRESAGDRIFSRRNITFQYEGPALNIESDFDVTVQGDVEGSVSAGGDVQCDAVGGSVSAGGDVSCDTVNGPVNAGDDVTADDIYGNVTAGGDVTADDVCGNVNAGGDVSCENVTGNVSAVGDVTCGEVSGSADAGGDLNGGKGFSFRIKI